MHEQLRCGLCRWAAIFLVAGLAAGCGVGKTQHQAVAVDYFDGEAGVAVSRDRARELVPFTILLPTYLPRGTSNIGTAIVLKDGAGERYLQTTFEDPQVSSELQPALVRLTQHASGIAVSPQIPGASIFQIDDVEGELLVQSATDAIASWRAGGSTFFLEAHWREAQEQEIVTGEVERTIRSIRRGS